MRLLLLLLIVPTATAGPHIVAVVPDLSGPGPGDEGLAIAADEHMDLSGYAVTDGETTWTVPEGTVLTAGEEAWFVGEAGPWAAHDGPDPAATFGNALRLANDGDDVMLRDPWGREVDAFRWGDEATGAWEAMAYTSPDLVYRRIPGQDTDTAVDWQTPRVHRIGESEHAMPTFQADEVTAFVSPDSSYPVVTGLMETARERIHLHVYELRSAVLVDAIVAAAQRRPGVDLQVLVEAGPVGQERFDRQEQAEALHRIEAAGGEAWLAGNGRYDYHHLKVLVVDDAVVVMTENWVPSGIPEDPSWGNRGWGVVVRSAEGADWMASVLAADRMAWDTEPFDLTAYDPLHEAPPRFAPRTGPYQPRFPSQAFEGPMDVTLVVSPEHTADPATDPVIALMGAGSPVFAEQLDLTRGAANDIGWHGRDAFMQGLATAGDGSRVVASAPFRVDDTENREAIDGLPPGLGCEFGVDGLVLHAKGTVAGDRVALGSMNQNHHSRSENREVSVIVASDDVAAYFRDVVRYDATVSCGPGSASVPAPQVPTLIAAAAVAAVLTRRC